MRRNLFRRTTGAASADDGSGPVYLAGKLLARLLAGFKVGSLETSTVPPLPGGNIDGPRKELRTRFGDCHAHFPHVSLHQHLRKSTFFLARFIGSEAEHALGGGREGSG